MCPNGDNDLHSCDSRNVIYGTAGFVTGSFGFACAAAGVRMLIEGAPTQIAVTPHLDGGEGDDEPDSEVDVRPGFPTGGGCSEF